VHDVEEAHDGGAVVGDGDAALVVVDELVHAPGPQRGPHGVRHRRARVDVAHHLRAPLRRVRALLEQDDLRLHHRRHGWGLREARVWSVREAGRGKRSERRERVLLFLEVSGGAATPSHHSPTGRCWPNGPTSVSKKEEVPLG